MHLSAQDIAASVGGELLGNGSVIIEGAAGLNEATEHEISFFHNAKYIESLQNTKAGAVFVPQKTNGYELPKGKTLIRVGNPQWAFGQILGILDEKRQHHPKGIHPKAHVESTAIIGKDTIIYPGCFIGHNVRIGDDCLIYANVVIREETWIGNRVIIQPGAVIGSDGYGFATQNGKQHKIPQIGNVVIEDDVELGANVAIDRATTGSTRIGSGTKIDNLVQIAHNVQIGSDCLITAQVGIAGSARVGDHVTMGGQVGISGHISIGAGAVIAAQSGVMSDIEPGEVLFGSPVRPIKEAMKLEAIYGKLGEIYDTIKQVRKKLL